VSEGSLWFEWPTLNQLGVLISPPRQPAWRKGARVWESPDPAWPLAGGFAPGSCGPFHRSAPLWRKHDCFSSRENLGRFELGPSQLSEDEEKVAAHALAAAHD
jgi:hypothetical protein